MVICIVIIAVALSDIAYLKKRAVTAEERAAASELTQAAQPDPDGVTERGRLSVAQGRLVDQYGEQIQLRGVSSHGIFWYPQYGNYRAVKTMRDAGANVYRIAMYTDGGGGYNEYPHDSFTDLRCTLENVLGADMYAIVDWHVLDEQDPNIFLNQAVKFFDQISSLYPDEPAVLYEICNEPNGETSWDDIKRYAEQVIPVIRKNSPQAVILVGTPGYSTKIIAAADSPLDFDNILYTYHYYADLSRGGYQKAIDYARGKGIGVFVSEWGIGNDHTRNDRTVRRLLDQSSIFLDYLDRENISWVSWSLSNKDEGSSLLKPDTQVWSGWSDNDLTQYGRFIFSRLRTDGES